MFPEFLINADWSFRLLIFGPQKMSKTAHKNMIRTVFPFWAELLVLVEWGGGGKERTVPTTQTK